MSIRGRETDAPVSVPAKARSCASMHSRMLSTRLTISLSINSIAYHPPGTQARASGARHSRPVARTGCRAPGTRRSPRAPENRQDNPAPSRWARARRSALAPQDRLCARPGAPGPPRPLAALADRRAAGKLDFQIDVTAGVVFRGDIRVHRDGDLAQQRLHVRPMKALV